MVRWVSDACMYYKYIAIEKHVCECVGESVWFDVNFSIKQIYELSLFYIGISDPIVKLPILKR